MYLGSKKNGIEKIFDLCVIAYGNKIFKGENLFIEDLAFQAIKLDADKVSILSRSRNEIYNDSVEVLNDMALAIVIHEYGLCLSKSTCIGKKYQKNHAPRGKTGS